MYIGKPPYPIAQSQFDYKKARITIVDDLFQQANSVDEAFSDWNKG
jgi:hypothetical protein